MEGPPSRPVSGYGYGPDLHLDAIPIPTVAYELIMQQQTEYRSFVPYILTSDNGRKGRIAPAFKPIFPARKRFYTPLATVGIARAELFTRIAALHIATFSARMAALHIAAFFPQMAALHMAAFSAQTAALHITAFSAFTEIPDQAAL